MKKIFLALLLVSLGGASLFADVAVGGIINGGFNFIQGGDDDGKTFATPAERGDTPVGKEEGWAANLMINGNFEKFGASVMIEAKGTGESIPSITPMLIWGYGWFTPFGEILKIDFGRLDAAFGEIQGMANNENNDELGTQGVRVLVSPISGLSMGFDLVEVSEYGGPPPQYSVSDDERTTENFFKSTLFGVKYRSKIFNAFATYKLRPWQDYEGSTLRYGITAPINKFSILAEGTNIKGPKDESFTYEWYQKVTYQITDPLHVSLRVAEKGDNLNKFDQGLIGLRFAAGYVINPSWMVSGRVEFAGRQNGFEDLDTQLRARVDWNIAPQIQVSLYDNYKIVTKDGDENVNTIALGFSCFF
jgi:hypothetical protein